MLEDRLLLSAATHLVVETQLAASITAGAPFRLVIAAEDDNGNVDRSYCGRVSLAATACSQKLDGATEIAAVNGLATFTNLSLERATSLEALYVSADGLSSVYSEVFAVIAAAATRLTVTRPYANSGGAGIGFGSPFSMTVDALDCYGNLAATFHGNVTLDLANNPSGGRLGGTLTATAVNGVATFSGVTLDKVGSGYTITAASAGLTSAATSPFDIAPHLVITTQLPSSITVGDPFGITVAAQDSYGNVVTSFNGDVVLRADDVLAVINGPNVTIDGEPFMKAVNGVATFSGLTLDSAGPHQSLWASADGLPDGHSNEFTAAPGRATRLGVFPPGNFATTTVTVGMPFTVTVTARDAYNIYCGMPGNLDPTFNGSVTLALADNSNGATLGGTLTGTVVNGVATFSGLTLDKLGSGYTLIATASNLTPGTSQPFKVAPQLVVTTQPPSSVEVGAPFGFVVTAQDGLGNVDTSFNGHLRIDGVLSGETIVMAVNGVATFSDLTIGTVDLSQSLCVYASDWTFVRTNEITTTSLRATHFSVATVTSVANSPFSITVEALNSFGDTDTAFSGDVTLTLANNPSRATLGGTLTKAAVGGVVTFSGLTLDNAGRGYTVTVSGDGLTSLQSAPFDIRGPAISAAVVAEAVTPKNGLLESNEKLRISWSVADPNRIVSQTMTVDGRRITPISGQSGGRYSCAIGQFKVGNHSYAITATDSMGVKSTSRGTFTVRAPVPPAIAGVAVVEVAAPSNGKIEPNTKLKLTWTASSQNGIRSQLVRINGRTITPINGRGQAYSCLIGKYAAGAYQYWIKSTDARGVSSISTGTFTVASATTASLSPASQGAADSLADSRRIEGSAVSALAWLLNKDSRTLDFYGG